MRISDCNQQEKSDDLHPLTFVREGVGVNHSVTTEHLQEVFHVQQGFVCLAVIQAMLLCQRPNNELIHPC